jgi:hypothetical protein
MSLSSYTAIGHAENCYRGLLNNPKRIDELIEAFGESGLLEHFNDPLRELAPTAEAFILGMSSAAYAITMRGLDEVYPSSHDDVGKCAVGTVVVCSMFESELPLSFIWPINVMLAKKLDFADDESQVAFAIMATRTYRHMFEEASE